MPRDRAVPLQGSERPDVVTVWWCETCCSQGVVAFAADAGVYEGFQRITDAHREAAPDCSTGGDRVRVRLSEEQPAGEHREEGQP